MSKKKSYVTIDVTLKVEMSEDCLEAFGIAWEHPEGFDSELWLDQKKFEQKCIRAMFMNNPRELIAAELREVA